MSNNESLSSAPLISIENLFKVFGPKAKSMMTRVHDGAGKDQLLADTGHTLGLRDINLNINRGEIFVIMGLSGSGKSTLIRHFNRLIDPTEGRIPGGWRGCDEAEQERAGTVQTTQNVYGVPAVWPAAPQNGAG